MVALETGTTPPPTGSSRLSSSTVLFVAALGAFLAFLDVTIVNVAFPNIRESFPGTSIGELSWVLNAYNIVLAASMVACGRLADLIGRRRLYITGLTVFVVASVLCATSGSVLWLVLARVVQAFGAAMLIPASLALVIDAFSSSRRAHAVGLWGASAAVAAGLGPPIGGALVEWGGWRWAFLVNVPVGLVALVAARRSLVESRSPGRRRMPDLRGALALAVALALLTTAITNGHDWGWSSLAVAFCLVGSAAASVGFVVSSRTHPSPLVDPQLLRVRGFVVANVASTVAGMGFYAYLLTNVLWLQYIWGYDVITSGLALVPAALVAAVVAALLGPVAQRHGYRLVVVPGALVWASAYLWYVVSVGTEPAFLTEWLPGQVLSGIGVGATLPLLGSASMASVPGGGYATASAVNASVRQLGGVLGIALLVVIIGDPAPLDAEQAFRHGWVFAAGCFVTAAAISIALGRPGTQDPTVEHRAEGDTHGQITVPDPSPVAPAGHSPLARAPLMSQLTSGARRELEESAEEVQVPAGQTLFAAGDVADAAYSVVSGRLEVDVDGSAVRLLGPGAVIGELALLTSGTRSATVRARRDSVLLRLRPASLLTVMERHPGAGGAVARVLADQLAHPASAPRRREASRTVAVVGLHRNAPTAGVAAALTACLAPHGRVASPGPVDGAGLARAERDHEVVLLLAADPESDPAWWANAVRQADRVIAVATTALRPTDARPALPAGCDLVLVGTGIPEADRVTWVAALDAWQVTCVPEVSPTSLRALAARTGGRSLGLALAGGGARALTHVGLLAALEEADVPVDRVSGCSVGGIVAGLHASGMSSSEMKETVYAEFVRRKPFSDYTVPRTSLAKGQRVRAALERAFGERTIEGLPGQLRCVSTDLLARTVHVHRRGSVVDALRATTALPGLFPPVVMDGRLLVDGGVLANLPFAPLLERDEGQVVAVNVSMGGADGTKSRRDPSRPPRVPLLGETLLRTMLIGSGGATAGATAAGLVVVTPPSLGVGLLEFHQFDAMYDAGLATGRQLVAAGGLPS
jgi:EmrB/QacA subfamily drug resistance transporter